MLGRKQVQDGPSPWVSAQKVGAEGERQVPFRVRTRNTNKEFALCVDKSVYTGQAQRLTALAVSV